MDNLHHDPAMAERINAPHVSITCSTLGGRDRASLMITLSLNKRETWQGGIMQNSHYMHLRLDSDGTLEHFGGYGVPHMRRCKVTSHEQAVEKINQHIAKIVY